MYRKPKNGADHPHVLTKKADSRKQPKIGEISFGGSETRKMEVLHLLFRFCVFFTCLGLGSSPPPPSSF